MSGLLLPIDRYTVTAASATGYLTVSSSVGIYPNAVFWLTLTNGSIPRQVEVTEVNGNSVGVRFAPEPGMPQTNYGRSNVSAYNAGAYLYQGEQVLYRSSEVPAQSPMAIGLQAYWKLDDVAEATGVRNLAVNNVTFGAGKIGNSVTLNSIASTVVAPGLDLMTDLTISAWVYQTANGDYYTVVSQILGSGGVTTNYHLIMAPGGIPLLLGTGDAGLSGGGTLLNQWNHIIATRTVAGYTEIWVNGSIRSSGMAPGPTSQPSANINIGCRPDAYSYFRGSIDEIGIWNRVITNNEIAFLYNAGSGISYPF